MHGVWRLHEAIAATPLDLFVMCSSSSALLNSPLLGVYAGSNAVLDALAHHRRAMGLTALSVNWGTWGEVGMAVEAGRSASDDMLTARRRTVERRGLRRACRPLARWRRPGGSDADGLARLRSRLSRFRR